MNTLENGKEIGRQFSEAFKKHKQNEKKIGASLVATLSLTNGDVLSDKGPWLVHTKSDDLNNPTEEFISETHQKQRRMISLYNQYCDAYECEQRNMVTYSSAGDKIGVQKSAKKMVKLLEVIKCCEVKIDNLTNEKLQSKTHHNKGRSDVIKGYSSTGRYQRRNFTEYK